MEHLDIMKILTDPKRRNSQNLTIRHYTMGEEDQLKLIKAGFRIIRSSPAFSTIYQRTAKNTEWHPLVENIKDLPSFEKKLQELVKDEKTVLFR